MEEFEVMYSGFYTNHLSNLDHIIAGQLTDHLSSTEPLTCS